MGNFYIDFIEQSYKDKLDAASKLKDKAKSDATKNKLLKQRNKDLNRARTLVANPNATVNAKDFDNVGYSNREYYKNPHVQQYIKVFHTLLNFEQTKKNENDTYRFTYKQIAKYLNNQTHYNSVTGEYISYNCIKKRVIKKENYDKNPTKYSEHHIINQTVESNKSCTQLLVVQEYLYICTHKGVRKSITTLEKMGLISKVFSGCKKIEAEDPSLWSYRHIIINYDKLKEFASIFSLHVLDDKKDQYTPKSKERKFIRKRLVVFKAAVQRVFNELEDNIKKRYKEAKYMFFKFIYDLTKNYYSLDSNKMLTFVADQFLTTKERLDDDFNTWLKKSGYTQSEINNWGANITTNSAVVTKELNMNSKVYEHVTDMLKRDLIEKEYKAIDEWKVSSEDAINLINEFKLINNLYNFKNLNIFVLENIKNIEKVEEFEKMPF